MKNELRQQTSLKYPQTWSQSAVDAFERLADKGKVDQSEVDRVESVLVWFRNVRDEFAGRVVGNE